MLRRTNNQAELFAAQNKPLNFELICLQWPNLIGLRMPVKATTLSGAWRPRDPVDDDQGGARA